MITHRFSDGFIIQSQAKEIAIFSISTFFLYLSLVLFFGFTIISVAVGYFISVAFFSFSSSRGIYRLSSVISYYSLRNKGIQYSGVSFDKIEDKNDNLFETINITYIKDKTRKNIELVVHQDEFLYSAMSLNNSPVEIHSLALNKLKNAIH